MYEAVLACTRVHFKISRNLDEPMDTELAGPPLPPHLVRIHEPEVHLEVFSDQESEMFPIQKPKAKKHSDKRKYKSQKQVTSSSEESEVPAQAQRSSSKKVPQSHRKPKSNPESLKTLRLSGWFLPSQSQGQYISFFYLSVES